MDEISKEEFSAAVQAYLDLTAKVSVRSPREYLAEAFEVAPVTVGRWAKGTAIPHPLLRKQVIQWIAEQV